MIIDFELVKPDGTGKYSQALYKWLTSKRRKGWDYRHVFQMKNRLDGESYHPTLRMNEIIIGSGEIDEGGTCLGIGGRTIGSIIRSDRGVSGCSFYYGRGFGLRDITEHFWAEYARIGRCILDHDHDLPMLGGDDRFTESADGLRRQCNWCGRKFEAEVWSVVEVHEHKAWNDYRDSAPATILYPCGSMGEEVAE